MTAPPITQYAGTIPNKGQSQNDFDTNVDDWLSWTTLTHAPELEAFGAWADTIRASLIAGNLPSLTGNALNTIRVNAAEDNVEFSPVTTVGWTFLAAVDQAAQRSELGLGSGALHDISSNPDLSVDPTLLPARDAVAAAIAAVPTPVKAWVNFDGTGTPAILAAMDVSSITDNGTGDYAINFTVDMPHANYAVSGQFDDSERRGHQIVVVSRSTTQLRFTTARDLGSSYNLYDSNDISVVVFA